ncbi:MAG: tetratricopeptide repeat protein [Acidobacteria bacterium]|nr:tetratricopeptide repeat protein [Acidobacteriota bacterium]
MAIVSGIAGVLFGVIAGYLIATQQGIGAAASPATTTATTETTAAASSNAPAINEQELQTYRDILKADPKNVRAATELGNRLYDAGRYSEAIVYYRQAFALEPKNINVSTDLATAIWYTGDADGALAQFEKSLAIDPTHGQTLFNIGIVKSQGKNDYKGASLAWEKLLGANPGYPEGERVRRLLDEAKAKAGA